MINIRRRTNVGPRCGIDSKISKNRSDMNGQQAEQYIGGRETRRAVFFVVEKNAIRL